MASSVDLRREYRLDDGVVDGPPRRWLRAEAGALLAGSLLAYSSTGQSWWLVAIALLAPDVMMVGYLAGTRWGAHLYNSGHSALLPALLVGFGWWQHISLATAFGLIWLAHIGLDRLLGYGLKYSDDFRHTHLAHLGAQHTKGHS